MSSSVSASMASGLDAFGEQPIQSLAAVAAIVALAVVAGLVVRRLTARMRTLRSQLLLIAATGLVVGAVAAWLLAALMVLETDQLAPTLAVLGLTAAVGTVIVLLASRTLGADARRLATTVRSIQDGDRSARSDIARRDELGRTGAALDELNVALAELEAAIVDAEAIIPEEQRDRYRRTVKQRGADALAEVDGSACSGCFTTVTAQNMNELINGHNLLFCMTCGRILYLAEEDHPNTRRTAQ